MSVHFVARDLPAHALSEDRLVWIDRADDTVYASILSETENQLGPAR